MTRLAIFALAVSMLFVPGVFAQDTPPEPARNAVGMGDLLVAPPRVILQGRDRSAELTLVNTGSSAATYRISFINLRMDEAGDMKEIEEPGPGERFADSMIRYSPRQVTLEPNVAQTIRLQVRKPADLEEGEYRSHILFRAVPNLEQMGGGVEGSGNVEGVQIRLIPIYGVSLPVIVRHGATEADVRLSDLAVSAGSDGLPSLSGSLDREGNRSVYVAVTARLKRSGEVIGQVKGLGVYVPNASRAIDLSLQLPEGRTISGETVVVTVTDAETVEERTLAEAELVVP